MRTIIVSLVALLLVVPVTGYAQDARATLERTAAAMGASGLTTVEGRTISFAVPDRLRAKATLTEGNLVDKVEAVIPNPVVGDLSVEIRYADYKDFGGVKFPMKISQSATGAPWFELAVNEVRPNAAVDIKESEPVRQAA